MIILALILIISAVIVGILLSAVLHLVLVGWLTAVIVYAVIALVSGYVTTFVIAEWARKHPKDAYNLFVNHTDENGRNLDDQFKANTSRKC